jgi:hypothetical protein
LSQGLRSFLEEVPRLLSLHSGGRDWFLPPIHFPPPLSQPGLKFKSPSQGKNDHHIDEEVEALLAKGAIVEVPLFPPSLSYISPIFLVPKKDGGMRPILNLKKLNAAHLDTPHFRMETVEDVRHALQPGDWATSIDLKDAYFHVLLHPSKRKYMRFGWKGRLFKFLVLSFGLSPAPKVFTSITRVINVNFGFRPPPGAGGDGHRPSSPPPLPRCSPCFYFRLTAEEGTPSYSIIDFVSLRRLVGRPGGNINFLY